MTADDIPLGDLPLIETDVLVVGAGPTGLMAGLVLARRGLRAEVIDAKAGPTRESRAIVVQARSMEIYDQLGLAEQVLEGANPALGLQLGSSTDRGAVDFARVQAGWTSYPGVQIFEQSRTEQMLSSALAAEGRPVRWGHELAALREGADEADEGVDARVVGPDGSSRIRACWCIGADGASSTVRLLLGLPFEGVTDDATFCVADLHGVTGMPDDRLSARSGKESFAIIFPLGPGGHARLICLSPTDSPDREEVLAAARADLALTWTSVDWFSAYRVHHRIAPRIRKGPTFLAGDAAHVHSPLGGQGMNTGLQDSHHLANLLADVASGHLVSAALEGYERERMPIARKLIDVTDRAFGLIARPGRGLALLRRRVSGAFAGLAPALLASPMGRRLGGLLGQYRIRYRVVPKGQRPPRWAVDPAVGLRLPPTADNRDALRSLGWQLHTYGHGDGAVRPIVPEWVEGPFAFGADARGRLRSDRLYLVRPDGFVAASFPLHARATARFDIDSALAALGHRRAA